ncbi:MAG: class I SAM-dependent methyltransferase [Candidatus Delongbacteria bacterium]|nr:class I SAM-dependent methyltransferase [Candidatus Delongbacteria bacterium]
MNDLERITKILKDINAGDILDIATGGGEFAYSLEASFKSFKTITGVDFNERAIGSAREKFKEKENIFFEIQDATGLNYDDSSFDTVTISNSLHHFEDPFKVLSEMHRVLKKNGYLIISEMHSDPGQREEQMTHVKLHHWWGEIDTLNGIVHNETFKSDDLFNIVNSLNLRDVKKFTYSFPSDGSDPKSKETLDHLNKAIDMYVARIHQSEKYSALINEAEEFRIRLNDIGFEPAGRVFILGKK